MSESSSERFQGPSEKQIEDPLTEVLREGARDLLQRAVELEVSDFLERFSGEEDDRGRRRVVRNGYLPERSIQTGIGGVPVRVPRVRDRGEGEKTRFHSGLVPPYLRRTKSVEELLPWLYLKGISTGDFNEALAALLGRDAPGLSPSTISRLKQGWRKDYEAWRTRDLSRKRFVYVWADGVYANVRFDDARLCLLVLIGADETGKKELLAVEDGYRESEQSWLELLSDLKRRGLVVGPKLAVGDGALGFWKALRKVYGETRQQRCWMHKTGNVLNALPRANQPKAKKALHEIWQAESRAKAHAAFDSFLATYELKYPRAVKCLAKDREELLAFYDFPAEQWPHLRTTNPIESTFATIRLRTGKTRGCLSRETMLTMVFKLSLSAQKRWRRLRGFRHLAEVIEGVQFVDGVKPSTHAA